MKKALHDPLWSSGVSRDVILPDPSRIFLDRSNRFTALAEGHVLADWLTFLGRLTLTQHTLLQRIGAISLADDGTAISARDQGLPPISVSSRPRHSSWRDILPLLAEDLAPYAPRPAQHSLDRLQAMGSEDLEILADRVLQTDLDGRDADLLPFIAAALQVQWTALATGIGEADIAPIQLSTACPCCGFSPVAGIIRTDGEVAKLRYLHCGLCNTEWHLVRVTCASCRDSNSIAYYHIEGRGESVRAETCDACRGYLKMVYQEKSAQADPVADDLATLALDLLVQEAGYERAYPNLLFAPGYNADPA